MSCRLGVIGTCNCYICLWCHTVSASLLAWWCTSMVEYFGVKLGGLAFTLQVRGCRL
jgi:hypothetical protein